MFSIKSHYFFIKFRGPGPSKSTKNLSKNEVNMGSAPGLHFCVILMDLGTQLGAMLRGEIEQRQARTGEDRGRQGKWEISVKDLSKNKSKIGQKSAKNQPRINHKSLLEDSWAALGASWRPYPKTAKGDIFF